MQDDRKPPGPLESGAQAVNLVVWVAQFVTQPVQLLTTRPGTAGKKYFETLQGGLGILLFPFWTAFAARAVGLTTGFAGVFVFWLVLIAARLVHLARGARLRRRGYRVHSRFEGVGWLTRPGKYEWDAALGFLIPLGFAVLLNCEVLFLYGLICLFTMWVPRAYQEAWDAARVDAAEDAMHDAEWLSDQLRRRRRGW